MREVCVKVADYERPVGHDIAAAVRCAESALAGGNTVSWVTLNGSIAITGDPREPLPWKAKYQQSRVKYLWECLGKSHVEAEKIAKGG